MRVEELVGQRIREIRELQELTQEEFGQELEPLLGRAWPRQTVSSAEKGGRSFTAAELLAISHVLNSKVERLFQPPIGAGDVELPTGKAIKRRELSRVAYPKASEEGLLNDMRETLERLAGVIQGARKWEEMADQTVQQLHDLLSTAQRLSDAPPAGQKDGDEA